MGYFALGQQFLQIPQTSRHPCGHGWRRLDCAMNPTEVVIPKPQRQRGLEIGKLAAKAI